MLYLRVVQAFNGDCLIVEYGTPSRPRFLLLDGGPDNVYANHLKPELEKIRAAGGKLDLVVLTHVDEDHIVGLLDLFAALEESRANREPPIVEVGALWENTFDLTVGAGSGFDTRLAAVLSTAGQRGIRMASTAGRVASIGQGNRLRVAALSLRVPLNPGFGGRPVMLETSPEHIRMDGLSVRVVGPNQNNLDRLCKKWQDWLEEQEEKVQSAEPEAAWEADTSVPNLSSIMLLLESRGKRILLTGDGLAGDLLEGLEQAGLLENGRMHVSVLKLPHHGSARNVTPDFLRAVTADTYVISANGHDDNPDLDTLLWIVDAAKESGRRIRIVATNPTDSTRALLAARPRKEFGYSLSTYPPGKNSMRV